MNIENIFDTSHKWGILETNVSNLDAFYAPLNGNFCGKKTTYRIIRGSNGRCSTKDRVFQEFAAALQFPQYFGWNWDAFDECITDLRWIHEQKIIVAIADLPLFLNDSKENLKTLISILYDSTLENEKLSIFFQCTKKDRDFFHNIFSDSDLPLVYLMNFL